MELGAQVPYINIDYSPQKLPLSHRPDCTYIFRSVPLFLATFGCPNMVRNVDINFRHGRVDLKQRFFEDEAREVRVRAQQGVGQRVKDEERVVRLRQ